jgi:hypothetical protein
VRVLSIAMPESMRARAWQKAADRLGIAAPIVSWRDIVSGKTKPSSLLGSAGADALSAVRIDAPDIDLELFALGSELPLQEAARRLQDDPGLCFGLLRHRGFEKALAQIAEALPGAAFFSRPEDIAVLCDKGQSQPLFSENGCPVPETVEASSVEQLRDTMTTRQIPRVFVKLRYGAAAMGLAACERLSLGLDVMWTRERGPLLIEANAFGDLLHDVRWRGMDTYEAQLRALQHAHRLWGKRRGVERA